MNVYYLKYNFLNIYSYSNEGLGPWWTQMYFLSYFFHGISWEIKNRPTENTPLLKQILGHLYLGAKHEKLFVLVIHDEKVRVCLLSSSSKVTPQSSTGSLSYSPFCKLQVLSLVLMSRARGRGSCWECTAYWSTLIPHLGCSHLVILLHSWENYRRACYRHQWSICKQSAALPGGGAVPHVSPHMDLHQDVVLY